MPVRLAGDPADLRAFVAINPAVVLVIAKIANEIDTFVKRQGIEKNQAEILKRLAEIQNKLNLIHADIREALRILAKIEVRIEEIPDEEAQRRIIGIIATITEDYPTWLQEKKPSQKALYLADAKLRLNDLRKEVRNQMTRRSYGNFHVVALAMMFEHDLSKFVQISSGQRSQAFGSYESYFHDALQATIAGSVAERQDTLAKRAAEIKAAHAGLPRFEGKLICWAQVIFACRLDEAQSSFKCRYDLQHKVGGGLEAGEYRREDAIYTNQKQCSGDRGCSGGEGECPRCTVQVMSFVETFVRGAGVPSIDPVQHNCPEQLNPSRDEYLLKDPATKALALALTSIQGLELSARKLKTAQ